MTDSQIKSLIENDVELLSQFLFIVYYTNPTSDRIKLIVDDGSIRLSVSREKFVYLFNELLQPRTFEMEKNFQRIKASLNSYGKWYYFDRIKNEFRELLEMPEKQHISPKDLFANKETIQAELNSRFVATVNEYNDKVLSKSPIPKMNNKIINKFYSFFKELNQPKHK
jgi:hypothetical protein